MSSSRKIYGILTILWCIFIFVMSGFNGNDSKAISDSFLIPFLRLYPFMGLLIRKLAHFIEYAVLSFLVSGFLDAGTNNKYWQVIIFCLLFALSDEYHQTFIIARSGQWSDVFIDFTGALITVIFIYIYNKKK